MTDKATIRTLMLKKRENLSSAQRNAFSQNICKQLWDIIGKIPNAVIHSYIPMDEEVNVLPLLDRCIKNGHTVASSKTLKRPELLHLMLMNIDTLKEGRFGTRFPKGNLEYKGGYDVIIVPGLAFDSENNRIGYGAGYYDHFLKNHPKALKLGVAFPFQVIDSLPFAEHDIKVDRMITPN